MSDTEFLKTIIGIAGVPIITGLVQMVKPFISDTRYHPFIAVGYGLLINLIASIVLTGFIPIPLVVAFFQGIMAGLAASGLYDAGRTIIR